MTGIFNMIESVDECEPVSIRKRWHEVQLSGDGNIESSRLDLPEDEVRLMIIKDASV